MTIDLLKVGKAAGAILSIVAVFTLVTTFVHTTVDEAVASEASDREQGDLRTRIEVILLELTYIEEKATSGQTDDLKRTLLMKELEIYQKRLQELGSS